MDSTSANGGTHLQRFADQLARAMVAQHRACPGAASPRWDREGAAAIGDMTLFVDHLADAILVDQPSLFTEYVTWAGSALASRGGSAQELVRNLQILADACDTSGDSTIGPRAAAFVREGIAAAEAAGVEGGSDDDDASVSISGAYLAALLAGDRRTALEIVKGALESGMDIREAYRSIFERSQHEVGRLWQHNKITVAQEHYCTAATQFIISQFYSRVFSTPRCGRRIVSLCVSGELHELGMRMVTDMFEIEGWDSHYLGASTPLDGIAGELVSIQPTVLAISATMSSHLHRVIEVIQEVRSHQACRGVLVLVGGRPFTLAPDLWERVGADGTASDGQSAVRWAQAQLGSVAA